MTWGKRRPAITLAGALVFAASVLFADVAAAKSTRVLDYTYATIWSTTVRLLRVDRGYEITDKDPDNGYLLFVYPGDGSVKRCPASLEIVAFVDEQGYQRHRLQLTIAHQASYVEVHLIDLLENKLLEEHGRPRLRKAKRPTKPPTAKDEGKPTNRDGK